MAEENQNKSHEYGTTTTPTPEVEIKDRGVFDFLGKKKEADQKPQTQAQEEGIVTDFDKIKVSDEAETKPPEEKHSLADMLHRSNSNSNSSSDEEEKGEGGEKKKKKIKEKKGLKEKIKQENTAVPVEKVEVDPAHPDHDEGDQEKKGFLDKIKGKLPGQHKNTEEEVPPAEHVAAPHAETTTTTAAEGEAKEEKKGLLEKIKEKMPSYHPKPNEEKEKESAAH